MGGDAERQPEYETAAEIAHERCFIGRTLAPEVAYEVGRVQVREDAALHADERPPAWRAA
jgi:hypothetical protein